MHSLRLICSGRPATGLQPAKGASPAAVWDADDLELHVWLAAGTMTCGVQDPFDITTLATLRLEMRETPDTEDMLCAAKEISSFTACTLEAFREGTGQHGTFEFSSTDTNFAATLEQVWISIVGVTTDGTRHTFTAGYLAIVRSGDSDASAPVNDPVATYTRLAFKTIAVSGQSNVVADAPDDTLTLAAGSGITITTNATTDTITITAADNDSAAVWGNITGNPTNQTDLINLLNAKVSTSTVAVTSGKVLTVSNTLTLTGTDSSTLNIGTGGTLGTAAFTASTAYASASHTHVSADVTDASEGAEGAGGKLLKIRAGGYIGGVYVLADGLPGEAGGQVWIKNVSGTFSTIFRAEQASAERTIELPDASGTLALQEWANGGNITTLGTITTGTWNANVIGSSYGGAGTVSGLLKANGSGTVSAAVAGIDYLTPSGNGSSLTALNATQLTSGTIPDARFPATLPAASGANLTNLPAANVTGTLAVANGGTGATNSYGILRAGMHGPPVAYPALWWTVATISGTVTSGTQASSFFPFLQVAAATNGQGRMAINIGNGGPVWPGGDNVVDYDKKAIARFRIVTQLSAHGDSKVAAHFAHTNPTSHTSYDRSVKGLSVVWSGGASAGTVYIQAHNGSTTTNSSTASFPINDVTGYNWTLEWEPGVAARLYRNGVLQCTLTTGLPSGTQGSSANGMVWIAGNTTNGTGNVTLFRFVHADFLEVP